MKNKKTKTPSRDVEILKEVHGMRNDLRIRKAISLARQDTIKYEIEFLRWFLQSAGKMDEIKEIHIKNKLKELQSKFRRI